MAAIRHFALYVNHERRATYIVPSVRGLLSTEDMGIRYGDRIQLRAYANTIGYTVSRTNMVMVPLPAGENDDFDEGISLFSPWFIAGLSVVTVGLLTASVVMKKKGVL